MSKYTVTLPIVGKSVFTIEAESEEDAITEALNLDVDDGEVELETVKTINDGAVLFHTHPNATAELDDSDD